MIKEMTLNDALNEVGGDALRKRVNQLLLGVQTLACVQDNLMDDIRRLLQDNGKYKFQLKRNMKQIQALVKTNMQSGAFFGKLSQEAIDAYMVEYEELEKKVYDFITERHENSQDK